MQAHADPRFRTVITFISGTLLILTVLGLVVGLIPPPRAVHADSSRIVSVYFDGQQRVISTNVTSVADVLLEAGANVGPTDLVEPDVSTPIPQGFFNINIYRSRPVLVVDGNKTTSVHTAYQSPKLIAEAAGITTYPEDAYAIEVVRNFTADGLVGQKVIIDRATPVTIAADGKLLVVRTQQTTVGALIRERDVALGPQDTVEPPAETLLTPGMTVRIYRVKTVVSTVEEKIAYGNQTIKDPEMDSGTSQVQTEGVEGARKVTYRLNYTDGVEVKRETTGEQLLAQPVTKVVIVGTRVRQDAWHLLRLCESGNNYQRNSGNGFYGAYQFDPSTWQSNGGSGMPHQASPAEQDRVARNLQARRGWQPWPDCSRRLGL